MELVLTARSGRHAIKNALKKKDSVNWPQKTLKEFLKASWHWQMRKKKYMTIIYMWLLKNIMKSMAKRMRQITVTISLNSGLRKVSVEEVSADIIFMYTPPTYDWSGSLLLEYG